MIRYRVATLACKSYLRFMSPLNIQLAFKTTGAYPLNRDVISSEILFRCKTFREKRPFEKIDATRSPPPPQKKKKKKKEEAIEDFLLVKIDNTYIVLSLYQKYLTRLGELIIFEPWLENYHFSQPS